MDKHHCIHSFRVLNDTKRQLSKLVFDEHERAQPRTLVTTEHLSVKPKPLYIHQTNSLHFCRLSKENRWMIHYYYQWGTVHLLFLGSKDVEINSKYDCIVQKSKNVLWYIVVNLVLWYRWFLEMSQNRTYNMLHIHILF